ncbi:YdeI family protein [Blastococcus sp. SYSU D00669]
MSAPTDLPVHRFADQAAFEEWLEAEHERSPGAYVVIAKKGAPEPTLTQQEMVESLLCFGWIDGRANRLDDHHYTIRVTPRRAKSLWSMKNVDWVGRLLEAGRMRPAGLAAVEAARADGRWDRAYAGPATITVPDDLAAALAAAPEAETAFAGLDGANRYAVLWRVHTATTPATRAKRIAALVEMLAEGRTIH